MENPILAALSISLLGMPLLFLALAFFYGLLRVLTSGLQDRLAETGPPESEGEKPAGDEALYRAAAVAVALARAEAEAATAHIDLGSGEGGPVSAWWSLHHQRQLAARAKGRGIS